MGQHNDTTQYGRVPNWVNAAPLDGVHPSLAQFGDLSSSASPVLARSSVKIESTNSNKFVDAIDMLTHAAQFDSSAADKTPRPKRCASLMLPSGLQDLLPASTSYMASSSPSSASSTGSLDSDTESAKSVEYEDGGLPPSKRRFLEPRQQQAPPNSARFASPDASLSYMGAASMTSNMTGHYMNEHLHQQHQNRAFVAGGGLYAPIRQHHHHHHHLHSHAYSAAPSSSSSPSANNVVAAAHPKSISGHGAASSSSSAGSFQYPSSSPSSSSQSSSLASSHLSAVQHGKDWCYRHANSDWAKYNWHVRSGGRYIMTEKAHRRYFACDVVGCRAVLYEDSPADEHTGEIIPEGELRMTLQRAHNHAPPESPKPCTDLLSRAAFLLKSLPAHQVRDLLIIEAGNGIGIPTMEHIHRCAERGNNPKSKSKITHSHTH
jgi:hypothetical protein